MLRAGPSPRPPPPANCAGRGGEGQGNASIGAAKRARSGVAAARWGSVAEPGRVDAKSRGTQAGTAAHQPYSRTFVPSYFRTFVLSYRPYAICSSGWPMELSAVSSTGGSASETPWCAIQRSASSAAMQPVPAAVMACR